MLCAPKAMRPDTGLQSEALGVRLLPIEMKDGRIAREDMFSWTEGCHWQSFEN